LENKDPTPSDPSDATESLETFEERERGDGKLIGILAFLLSVGFLGLSGDRADGATMIISGWISLLGISFWGMSSRNKVARLLGAISLGIVAIVIIGFIFLFCAVFLYAGATNLWNIFF